MRGERGRGDGPRLGSAAIRDSATGAGSARRSVAFYTDARAWPGGAEVYLTGLMRWLRGAGWSVRLLTSDRAATRAWVDAMRAEGFDVACFRPYGEVSLRAARDAERMLRGSDVVHFNKTDVRTCLPAIPAASRAGVRVVVATEHVTKPVESHYPLGARFVTALVRHANGFVDRTLVVSEESRRQYLANFRSDPSKVIAVRGGVDAARFSRLPGRREARAALGLPQEAEIAVNVGRLSRGKGQDALIECLPQLRERRPDVLLALVGDGPCSAEFRELALRKGVADRVVFTGSRSDVEVVLAASDVFVLASSSETLSLCLLEAMAAALPVVSTACGGPNEIVIDGVTGRLVPVGDAPALVAAVADVLASPDRGAAMGRAGRVRAAAEFDVRANYAGVAALYEELLAAAEGRRA